MAGAGAIAEEDEDGITLDNWASNVAPNAELGMATLSPEEQDDAAFATFLSATIVAPTPSLLTGNANKPKGGPPGRPGSAGKPQTGYVLPPPSFTPNAGRAAPGKVDLSSGAVTSVLDELDSFDSELQMKQNGLPFDIAQEQQFNPYMNLGQGDDQGASKWDNWNDNRKTSEFDVGVSDGIVEDWSQVQDPWRLSLGTNAGVSTTAPPPSSSAKKGMDKASLANNDFSDPSRMSMAFGAMQLNLEDFGSTFDDDDDDDLPF
jgi:hypothetical protein